MGVCRYLDFDDLVTVREVFHWPPVRLPHVVLNNDCKCNADELVASGCRSLCVNYPGPYFGAQFTREILVPFVEAAAGRLVELDVQGVVISQSECIRMLTPQLRIFRASVSMRGVNSAKEIEGLRIPVNLQEARFKLFKRADNDANTNAFSVHLFVDFMAQASIFEVERSFTHGWPERVSLRPGSPCNNLRQFTLPWALFQATFAAVDDVKLLLPNLQVLVLRNDKFERLPLAQMQAALGDDVHVSFTHANFFPKYGCQAQAARTVRLFVTGGRLRSCNLASCEKLILTTSEKAIQYARPFLRLNVLPVWWHVREHLKHLEVTKDVVKVIYTFSLEEERQLVFDQLERLVFSRQGSCSSYLLDCAALGPWLKQMLVRMPKLTHLYMRGLGGFNSYCASSVFCHAPASLQAIEVTLFPLQAEQCAEEFSDVLRLQKLAYCVVFCRDERLNDFLLQTLIQLPKLRYLGLDATSLGDLEILQLLKRSDCNVNVLMLNFDDIRMKFMRLPNDRENFRISQTGEPYFF